ncbi:MAG: type II toxin-antitoxin system VapC family toxin [Methanosarcinales archaeon]|nr:type II toxin-antitoxin system VapC family toxin [Methanosarcinales archaeon]
MKYVDSNIFIHNLIGDSRMGDAAEKFLKDVANGRETGVTSVHTMVEIYAFLKSKRMSEQKISDILSQINEHGVILLPFEPEFLVDALLMTKNGWKIGDAIHINTMLKNKISGIVTDDRHFNNVDGITRIDLLIE